MKISVWTKITIAVLSFCCMGDMAIIPAFGDIFAAFPNENPNLLNFIMTGPMLVAGFSSVLCGFLAKCIRKKYLLLGSYIVYAIATCGGALFVNIYYMVMMRAIAGFAMGIIAVAVIGMIADLFTDEAERSSMMGLFNGTMAVIGIILSFVSGFLAVGSWQHSFYLYWMQIPIIIMIIVFLPKTPVEKVEKSVDEAEVRLPIVSVGALAIAFFVFNALYCIICYFIAIYLQEVQMGDSSTAGIITALATGGSACAGFLFCSIYMRFKCTTAVIFYFVMAVAYVVLSFHSNIWVVGAMCTIAGAAYGLGISYYYMRASMIVPPSSVSLAIAIMAVSVYLGGYFSPIALQIYQAILRVDTITPTLCYIGMTLAICGALSIIPVIRSGKCD